MHPLLFEDPMHPLLSEKQFRAPHPSHTDLQPHYRHSLFALDDCSPFKAIEALLRAGGTSQGR